jgi:hypothetical protein
VKIVRIILVLLAATIALFALSQAEKRYDVVVSFGSICCGPNEKAMEEIETLMKRFEQAHRVKLEVQRKHWGLEGETELCIDLDALPLFQRGLFIAEASGIAARSAHTHLKPFSVCEGWTLVE